VADQERISICSPDFIPADPFDVMLVFGVDRFIELKVSKIEIDVLVFFPRAQEMVVLNVCAIVLLKPTNVRGSAMFGRYTSTPRQQVWWIPPV
jgi:hypothetical protein